jgi:hypothetical protein
MSMKIPSHFDIGADVDMSLSGVPTDFTVNIGSLPKIDIAIDALPKIAIGIDPLNINLGAIDIKPLSLNLGPIELKPIDLSFSIKELPSMRMHFPMDYRVGLGMLGRELFSVRFCGQGQMINEPYVPNPCECGFRAGDIDLVKP